MRRRRVLEIVGGIVVVVAVVVPMEVAHGAARAVPKPPPGRAAVPIPTVHPMPATGRPFDADPAVAATTGPFDVASDELVLDDSSRSAPDRGGASNGAIRELRVVLRRPVGTTAPVPLIVFAHGYNTEPGDYDALLNTWAAAGYLVAAPEMPGSARDLPGSPLRDVADQARDLSFVVTALLDRDPHAVDPNRIVAAGHSDGASAVATLALNSAFTDPRFNAYMVLSGAIPTQVEKGDWRSGPTVGALLVVVGDQDDYGNAQASQTVFDTSALPGVMVRVVGGDHSRMYLSDNALGDSVRSTTVQFLDFSFNHPPSSSAWDAFGDDDRFVVRPRDATHEINFTLHR
jgi:dienelactone hydrolase